jgi:hypothetical protein
MMNSRVRHREHHVGALAVLEPEELGPDAVVAAAALPQLGGLQHRHEHLLPADRVDLLADDLHDVLVHAPSGRQPGPQAGAQLADQSGTNHQLVRQRLGVGGWLPLGRQEELAHAHVMNPTGRTAR